MRLECRVRFPRHRLQRKTIVSDPVMHHGTCVTHVPWCMLGSLIRGGGKNVPDIPSACATHSFTYMARGPLSDHSSWLTPQVRSVLTSTPTFPAFVSTPSKTPIRTLSPVVAWVVPSRGNFCMGSIPVRLESLTTSAKWLARMCVRQSTTWHAVGSYMLGMRMMNYINPGYGLSLVDTLWNASSYRQPLDQEGNPMT